MMKMKPANELQKADKITCIVDRSLSADLLSLLRGLEIPLLGRMIAVGDTYDAMTSDRPYRRKRNRVDAISEIEQCSGSQFDPQVVKAFIEVTSHKIF